MSSVTQIINYYKIKLIYTTIHIDTLGTTTLSIYFVCSSVD